MATIVFQQMSKLVTDYVMGASGTVTPPASWTMGFHYGGRFGCEHGTWLRVECHRYRIERQRDR